MTPSISPPHRPRWASLQDVRRAVPGVTTEVLRAIVDEPLEPLEPVTPSAAPAPSSTARTLLAAFALAALVAAAVITFGAALR